MQNPTKIPQGTKRVLDKMENTVEKNTKLNDLKQNVMQGNRSIRDVVKRSPANIPNPQKFDAGANRILRRLRR